MVFSVALVALVFGPLALTLLYSRTGYSKEEFLTNKGRNNSVVTLASTICGNIGVGTFVAIHLFTRDSQLIGFSIAGAYTLGLVLAGLLAPKIHAAGLESGAISLPHLIASRSGLSNRLPVWLPLAIVFIIRSSVQLAALALLVDSATGIGIGTAVVLSGLAISAYTTVGGYRAAVETDLVQAVVILVLMAVAAASFFLASEQAGVATQENFFSLGSYQPALLVGIWLFLPFSAVLAVDNWQRISVCQNPKTARTAFLVAALICGAIYFAIALISLGASASLDVFDTFRQQMPGGLGWLADILFIACIMSSIDTFVMPLVSGYLPSGTSMRRIRWTTFILFAMVIVTTLVLGSLLQAIVAAFSSLAVFLPATFNAIYLKRHAPISTALSMNAGLIVAIVMTFINQNAASVVGFLTALIIILLPILKDFVARHSKSRRSHQDG